jgi:signal transduction histidine kinase
MFRDATLRLTGLYVAVLALICLFFSVNLYRVSTTELDAGLRQETVYLQNAPQFGGAIDNSFLAKRDFQFNEAKQRILLGLIELDLFILILGGVGSYFLARRTVRPIEEAHNAQVRFTADASHELRTPLAAMRSEIEVALRDRKLTTIQAKQLFESNLEELQRLTGLTDSLLKLARDAEVPKFTTVSLAGVVVDAVVNVTKAATEKNITLKTSGTTVKVKADRSSLTQLIMILLDNAIKYSPTGTIVTVETALTDATVMIRIADQGTGIAPADLPHIFERFYRADQSRSQAQVPGYGLGLAIAKQLAELHHGSLSVESTPGQGSIFTIQLPQAKPGK